MTVGILTYHRSQNYGAQIQAFALQEFLRSLGCGVSIIDYWPEYHKNLYKPKFFVDKKFFKSRSIWGKMKLIIRSIVLFFLSCLRKRSTNCFVKKLLNVSSSRSYDIAVYGSDQIWRKQHMYPFESYNPIYFGDDQIEARYKISYAASMGRIEAENDEDISFLRSHFQRFDAISVREKELCDFISKKLEIESQVVCDPVLLLTKEQWNGLIPNGKDKKYYIFKYNLVGIPEIDEIALLLSNRYHTPIVEYCGYVNQVNRSSIRNVTSSAIDFLRDLMNAEYVVTSSFHGVALSLCFEKQFYFASIKELSNRTENLLEKLDLKDRIISGKCLENIDFSCYIDYSVVSGKLSSFRIESASWLISRIKSFN